MPSRETVQRALAAIRKQSVNYEYFFDHLDSPDWLAALRAEGFFKQPPAAQRSGDMVGFPCWPEARYLARIAPRVPDAVLDLLLKLPTTDNVRVHADLVAVALALPVPAAASWAKHEEVWLDKQTDVYFLPEPVANLAVYLVSGGEVETGLSLASTLFATRPDPDVSRPVRDVQVKMDTWHYGDLLRRYHPLFIAGVGERALDLFADLLANALLASRDETSEYTWAWRPAIEPHEQNIGQRPLDYLVDTVRDAAEALAAHESSSPDRVATRLIERGGVFTRIAFHILARVGDRARDVTASCLGNHDYFDSLELRHEYDQLLKAEFGRLPQSGQAEILGWIEAEPGQHAVDLWKARSASEEDVRRGIRMAQRDRLYPIRDMLPDTWKQRYAELVAAVGEPDHPGFTSYRRTFIGPATPKSAEELRTMSIADIVQYLATWKPTDDWMQPSEEGLGRALEKIVADEPNRFALEWRAFTALDPTYVRSVLAGFFGALRGAKAFDWTPVLQLGEWVIAQPRDIPERRPARFMRRDPDWGWARKQIADLLAVGLEDRVGAIPFGGRGAVWNILVALSEDPDPDAALNDKLNVTMDPLTQSLNTVRGRTMHAVMRYALWQRHAVGASLSDTSGIALEVRELLDARLAPQREPAVAVRAVYGDWFACLAELEPLWTQERVKWIFPTIPGESSLRLAAWETYLASTRPTAKLYSLLEEQYRWALTQIGAEREQHPQFIDPEERLAEHLMNLYWEGSIALHGQDGMLDQFFAKASLKLREHAISFVGRALHGTANRGEPLPTDVKARVRVLLEYRFSFVLADAKTLASELRGFCWWFSASVLDIGWRFVQLKSVLSVFPNIEGDFLVMAELQHHVVARPQDVLECLDLMLRCANPSSLIFGSRARLEAILSTTARSSDPDIRRKAVDNIHRLGALGHIEFRGLLDDRSASS